MFNVSFGEIFAFSIIALIILGPEKFPQVLRSVMLKYQNVKKLMNKVQQDFEHELELMELKQFMQEELARIKENENQLKSTLLEMQLKINETQSELNTDVINKEQRYLYIQQKRFNSIPFRPTDNTNNEVKDVA